MGDWVGPVPAVPDTRRLTPQAVETLGQMVAIALVDDHGRLTHVSDQWCTLTGWRRSDVLGAHWKMIVHPDDLDRCLRAGRTVLATGQCVRMESRVVSRDGQVRWIESQVTPMREGTGPVTQWLMVATDTTPHREATAALARSERRLQVIFDSSTDIITIVEPDGRWRATSGSGAQLLGYGHGDLPPGTPLPQLVDEDRPLVERVVADLLAQGTPRYTRPFECRVRTSRGQVRWLETTAVNLVDDPAVGGVVFHSRDVTERHAAAEELRTMASRLTSLVANLNVGVIMADDRNETIYANRAAADLFGLGHKPEDMVGRDRPSLLFDLQRLYTDPDAALARITEILRQRRPVLDETVQFADRRTLARSFIPIDDDDGASHGHLWLFRDLGQEMAIAAERDYLLEMEKQQNARLTELDALKTDLVAQVSHELRTPLTSIVSFMHLLRQELEHDGTADQLEFLGIIGRNTDRLLRLVGDLLLLDRLESSSLQLTLEPVDVVGLAEVALTSLRPVAEGKGVTLGAHLVPGRPLRGDADRLGQLIDNLVMNAIKFTPPGGTVVLAVEPLSLGWRIEVSDTGIGIPVTELDQIFQRFFRGSNARQEAAPGSGLGLVIVLRIAELHGGGVSVSSQVGLGTTVTVTMVGAPEPASAGSPLAAGIL